MDYLSFSKDMLVNLENSLNKEFLKTNVRHVVASSSLSYCKTRKYHGLFSLPQPNIDTENHLLLSSLDESIIQDTQEFNLAIHKYPGEVYYPKGHKYLQEYTENPIPKHTYRIGNVLLSKEILLHETEYRLLIRYKIIETPTPVFMRLRPMLAFRQIHKLAKVNSAVNIGYNTVENGINICMYEQYTPLYIQFSKENEYNHNPDWYYNFEYQEEKERGYDYLEDLYTPGCFELTLTKGEELLVCIGLENINASEIEQQFYSQFKKQPIVNSMFDCLKSTARSFFVKDNKGIDIIAGFPWFGRWGRDTFISLPGLTLSINNVNDCKAVIDTMLADLNGALFPNMGAGNDLAYNSVDAPLWFFWALQQYAEHTKTKDTIWKEYGTKMQAILNGFKNGDLYNIHITNNGLVWAGEHGKALTWMDAIVDGKPVTARMGMPVEINALWYNALMFSIEVAELANDKNFTSEWKPLAELFVTSFKNVFWDKDRGWLADYVDNDYKDFSIRPNMIFAVSLPYSPLSLKIKQLIVEKVKKELLTPMGLRTLSPTHPDFKDRCYGTQTNRDLAYHQGTVWPWLFGHFAEAYLHVYGKSGFSFIENYYNGFEETLFEAGIGSISEIYDGNPPHTPRGAISQAWSVAEILRTRYLLDQFIHNGELTVEN